MSAASYELLETLQADILAVLLATPALANAAIIADSDGDTESKVTKALAGTVKNRANKYGLAVIVLAPEVTSAEANLPGPPLLVRIDVQTLEHVQTNRAATGTGLRSSHAAMIALSTLHLHQFGAHVLYADKAPIEPLPATPGLVSHSISLYLRANGITPATKPQQVSVTLAAGLVTLTCATGGSTIRYSTDGSYPRPEKTLYSAPFALPAAGTVIRAAAYVTGQAPGDVLEFTVTP